MLKKRHGLAFTLISTFLMWGKDFVSFKLKTTPDRRALKGKTMRSTMHSWKAAAATVCRFLKPDSPRNWMLRRLSAAVLLAALLVAIAPTVAKASVKPYTATTINLVAGLPLGLTVPGGRWLPVHAGRRLAT